MTFGTCPEMNGEVTDQHQVHAEERKRHLPEVVELADLEQGADAWSWSASNADR